MPDPLIGARALPPVSILQMILEGPKGYFGRRGQMEDTQWLQQQQQQQQGAFAQNLIKTPEWQQAMANPYDRQAQGGLWAAAEGGPGNIPAQGANWLQSVISGAYGREQQTLANTFQRGLQEQANTYTQQQQSHADLLERGRMAIANTYGTKQTSFEDELQKSRMRLGTDEALRLEQGKMDLANKQLQEQMKLFQPDAQTGTSPAQSQFDADARYDIMAHALNLKPRPDGYSFGTLPGSNQQGFVPTYGGKPWQEMTAKLSPLQAMNGAVDELMDLDASGSTDTGRRQQLVATIQDQIRTGSNMGSLDAGASAQMAKYINDYGSYAGYGAVPVGSKNYATAQEKLRGLKISTQQKIQDWSRTYIQDPGQMGDPYAYTKPSSTAKKLTDEQLQDAEKKMQAPTSQSQPAPSSKVNRGARPAGAPSVWDTGPGRDTGMSSRGRGGK